MLFIKPKPDTIRIMSPKKIASKHEMHKHAIQFASMADFKTNFLINKEIKFIIIRKAHGSFARIILAARYKDKAQKIHSIKWFLLFIQTRFYNKSITKEGKSPITIFIKIVDYDVIVKVVLSLSANNTNQTSINGGSLAKGMHLIQITTDTNLKQVLKFIVD